MHFGISLRQLAFFALVTAALAIYSTTFQGKDDFLMPEPKRTWRDRFHWRRWSREREEEGGREAEEFLGALRDTAGEAVTQARRTVSPARHRHRKSPSPDSRPRTMLIRFPAFEPTPRDDPPEWGKPPWDIMTAPPAPEPRFSEVPPKHGELAVRFDSDPSRPAKIPKRDRPLEVWHPSDGSEPPTLVGDMLKAITPEMEEYLEQLRRFDGGDAF